MITAWVNRNKAGPSVAFVAAIALGVIGSPVASAQPVGAMPEKPGAPVVPARLPDGHPNWTGFWSAQDGLLEHNIGLGGSPEVKQGPNTPPPQIPVPFADFPAIKSPYRERLAVWMGKMMKDGFAPDTVAQCYPPGMPRMMAMVYGMEILQTPGQIAVTSEWQAESRRIWLDRKDHPPADELDPTYAGDSVGHWEGDTLVVDTVGIREDVPVNYTGLMHGPKLHIVERWTQTAPGVLAVDFAIDDPDLFDGVWHHTEYYRHRPDLHLEEYVCLDNNRNVGANGGQDFSKDPSRK